MADDARLEQILGAAYLCFTRHGVRRTTMDDIARQAGMSRPGVYQYVRSKEDAFRRLAERLLDSSLTAARARAAAPGTLSDRLTSVLLAKLDMTMTLRRDSPAHAAELLGADTRLTAEPVDAYNADMTRLLADTVAAARPDADAREFAAVLLALTRGLEADLSDPEAPARRLRHGVALLVNGLDHPRTNPKESQ